MKHTTILQLAALVLLSLSISANAYSSSKRACSKTSQLMRAACRAETRDDFLVEKAKCFNESERGEKGECIDDASESFWEDREACNDQFNAREDVCGALGQAPYDPSFEAEDFEIWTGRGARRTGAPAARRTTV